MYSSNFEKKICELSNKLLDSITYKQREAGKILEIQEYIGKVKEEFIKAKLGWFFDEILEAKYMIFGNCGECGLIVFLDYELKEVFRLAYEDGNSTFSWFIKEDEDGR